MIQDIPIETTRGLDEYAEHAHLFHNVRELRAEAKQLAPALAGRTVWMVNSTAKGGGVAEMMPRLAATLGELGVDTRWLVMGATDPRFFELTKRIHNLIHGSGRPGFDDDDRALFERVNREAADEMRGRIAPDDILAVHDPQPMPLGAFLGRELGVTSVWRCHIGLDRRLDATSSAWRFLEPYGRAYEHAVFTLPEYAPKYMHGRWTVIQPAIDPLSDKNREIALHKIAGVLVNAGLVQPTAPVVAHPFVAKAERLRPDGSFGSALEPEGIGLLFRPIVTQISRWDRLKGWRPLLDAFVRLKRRLDDPDFNGDPMHRRRIESVRLVLAGPDPASIQDDPEGVEVLEDLKQAYAKLPAELQGDVAILSLPMVSRAENELIVNVLQRCSTVVVQNSLREGFGLTATEAMWKRAALLGTHACGLRAQVRDGLDGQLTQDPENPDEVAERLDAMLSAPVLRSSYGRSAQRRVHSEFLVFTQVSKWLRLLHRAVTERDEGSRRRAD